jgi:hypothetical protein
MGGWMIEGEGLVIAVIVFAIAAFFGMRLLGSSRGLLSIVLFAIVAVFALPYLPIILTADLISGLALVAIAVLGAQWFLGISNYWNIAALLLFVFVVGSAAMGLV